MREAGRGWIVNLSSGVRRRLTVDEVDHFACAWSSDGRRVFMNSLRTREKERYAMSYRLADGTGPEFALVKNEQNLGPDSASPDGRHLLYTGADAKGILNLLAVPLDGDPRPIPLADGPASESAGQFSPDGRLVAFNSDESGRDEIYVVTFPPTGAKWQVSQNGGGEPRWSRDGRELYFVSGGRLAAGSTLGWVAEYTVDPDGVTIRPEGDTFGWTPDPPETLTSGGTAPCSITCRA